jgi:hypothetical protein
LDSPRIRALVLAVIALPLFLALVGACGDDDEAEVTSTPAGESATPRAPLGPYPADYPEDFPEYPNASLGFTSRIYDQVLVTLSTDDSRSIVADFYRQQLSEEPWSVLVETEEPAQNQITIRFKHNTDDITGTLTIATSGAETSSTVMSMRFVVDTWVGPSAAPLPTIDVSPGTGG